MSDKGQIFMSVHPNSNVAASLKLANGNFADLRYIKSAIFFANTRMCVYQPRSLGWNIMSYDTLGFLKNCKKNLLAQCETSIYEESRCVANETGQFSSCCRKKSAFIRLSAKQCELFSSTICFVATKRQIKYAHLAILAMLSPILELMK